MLKPVAIALLAFLIPFGGAFSYLTGPAEKAPSENTGTLEKLIVADGSVAMELDLNRLNGTQSRSKTAQRTELRFDAEKNSFFTILVFNDELRTALPSGMPIIAKDSADLPSRLNASYKNLVVEKTPFDETYELVVRDGKTGFVFFNIEGHRFKYDSNEQQLSILPGRLLISKQFATELGRPADAGAVVGQIAINVRMRQIEVTEIVDGEVKSNELPASSENAGTVPGPDVIVGDVYGLAQFGLSSGTRVGLAVGTNSCNFGTVDLNWFALPSNDHPVIPQNMYRMSGGTNNEERFEQIGQSNVKHAFTALTQNLCALGCNGVGGSRLGSGCSDPYSASLNAGPNLGSKAWINPFTGDYPRGDSVTPPNSHGGHSHNGTTHRILTEMSDLSVTANPGAKYFAEGQYVTPHEYAWCQANPTQCNMNNNVSYRQYNVSGTGSPFSFSPAAETVRQKSAIAAWPGATAVAIQPDPTGDGIGAVVYKVTNPSPGVWHYEYVVYNQNLDRGIQSFEVPLGNGVTLNNVGFHAPPQHPGSLADGTAGDQGFSETPWAATQTAGSMKWNSETFAQNANANAIRWATLYNFRFDSNRPPTNVNATVGFFKTGSPATIQIQGPSAVPGEEFVSVSGRVTTAQGQGIFRAYPYAVDSQGGVKWATTNAFGFYTIPGLVSGGTYTIGVASKRYTFNELVMPVNSNLENVNFVADP